MSFFKHVAEYDVGELSKQIDNHPELWDAHTVRKTAPNTPHSRMSDIWVRYNDVAPFEKSGDYRTFNDRHVPIWYPAWTELPALRPILFDLLAQVEGEMIGPSLRQGVACRLLRQVLRGAPRPERCPIPRRVRGVPRTIRGLRVSLR